MKISLALLFGAFAVAGPPTALQRIEVRSIDVAEVSADRVRLRVHLGGVAERDIAIRTLTFDEASLNGIPLFAPPVAGPIRISKGMPFSRAGALEATVFYRDLPSLEPVRRMIREEKAVVRSTMRLQPDLGLMQRIALRTSNAWVSWKMERSVKVQVPGNAPGKAAAELALAAADAMWVVGQRGLEWRRERDVFLQHVWQNYSKRVLPVETHYTVVPDVGTASSLVWRGLAFHSGGGELLVPAEAVEPWMFDGTVADALAAGGLEVRPEALDVKAGEYSIRKGSLAIATVGRDRGKGLSVERRRTYALRDRNSSANVARLYVGALTAEPVKESAQPGEVAVFRLRNDGARELLMLSAAIENGRIRLVDPVDSRAFGSPVVSANGVLGIVVGQTAVAPLREPR